MQYKSLTKNQKLSAFRQQAEEDKKNELKQTNTSAHISLFVQELYNGVSIYGCHVTRNSVLNPREQ